MKPDPIPPTIPFLSLPMNHKPAALPSLSRRIASWHVDWHSVAARALLAVYVAAIVFSSFRLHARFIAERAAHAQR